MSLANTNTWINPSISNQTIEPIDDKPRLFIKRSPDNKRLLLTKENLNLSKKLRVLKRWKLLISKLQNSKKPESVSPPWWFSVPVRVVLSQLLLYKYQKNLQARYAFLSSLISRLQTFIKARNLRCYFLKLRSSAIVLQKAIKRFIFRNKIKKRILGNCICDLKIVASFELYDLLFNFNILSISNLYVY